MSAHTRIGLWAAALFAASFLAHSTGTQAGEEGDGNSEALALFEQRIMPIFRSPQPSSCIQCHLASVDLKAYILPSHEKTFVSLRDQGLIDLDEPERSKILKLIRMGAKDPDEGARLIHEKTRRAEYDAFAAWVKACCSDERLRNLPPLDDTPPARPEKPDPVIRHARKSRVVDSFVRNIWSQRMRCFPCHTPHEIDQNNPQHRLGLARRREYVQKFGQRMNIFRESPAATMQYLVEASRHPAEGALPLLDLEQPRKSLLVLKPTSKLPPKDDSGHFAPPSYREPVSHMGGLKMHVDDQSYKSFIAWIQDYARVVGEKYVSVEDLPADDWYPTKYVLRMQDTPESWAETTPVQLFVYAWDAGQRAWQPEPIAFTQGTVTPRRMVNGALFLLAGGNAERKQRWQQHGATLPPGNYLVKAYVDASGRLAKDPTELLGEDDFRGQVELHARWREGFRDAELIAGGDLRR